jgi:hypothetical protein
MVGSVGKVEEVAGVKLNEGEAKAKPLLENTDEDDEVPAA